MQIRRPALWITNALLLCLTIVLGGYLQALHEPDPKTAAVQMALAADIVLPIGYAFMMSDRAVRDRRLAVGDLLDTTPASRLARLLGKYTGTCAAAGMPITVIWFASFAGYAIAHRAPTALAWATAVFATALLPAIAAIGALALCLPLVVPLPVFRTLVVGFWFWTSWLLSVAPFPTLGETVLSTSNGYAIQVFFGYHGSHGGAPTWAGPVPGAPWNELRPAPTAATAVLATLLLPAIAVTILIATHLLRQSRAR